MTYIPAVPPPYIQPPVSASSPHWVLDEDDALKVKLSGFEVINYADGRTIPVQVFYGMPDAEEVQRKFPHFSIDLVSIEFAAERAHRAYGPIVPYDLEQATPSTGTFLTADDFPLPWDLIYQISAYSRDPRHDRQLSLIMYQLFPQQMGGLNMQNYDGTIRRADLISSFRRDTVDADNVRKRMYRQIFTVSISSEFYLNQIQYVAEVLDIDLTVVPYVNETIQVPGTVPT